MRIAVGGAALAAVVADLDALLVQTLAQRVDLVRVELELLDHARERGLVDAAALAAGLEESSSVMGRKYPTGAVWTPVGFPSVTDLGRQREAADELLEGLGGAGQLLGGRGDLLRWRRWSAGCEAETCSADAEDCSATAATSPMEFSICARSRRRSAGRPTAISVMRAVMSSTAAPMRSNASRVCSTVATPSSVRWRAVGDDTDDLLGVGLDLADQARDLAGGVLGLLGELADLLGDDGEAAALLAGAGGLDGGVEREQVGLLGDAGDRVDDPADPLGARGELLDRARRPRPRLSATWRIAPRRLLGGGDALAGDLARLGGRRGGLLRALGAGGRRAGGLLRGLARGLDHADLALGALRRRHRRRWRSRRPRGRPRRTWTPSAAKPRRRCRRCRRPRRSASSRCACISP